MSERIQTITVPKWGLTMEEGKVVAWLVDEGQTLATGDEVLELETSKIANVVEAQYPGTLRRIVAAPDEELPVGALLGVLAESDVSDADIDAFVADFQENFVPEKAPEDSASAEPNFVDIGTFRIAWNVTGDQESTRAPLLFIHGFGGDGSSWLFNIAALSSDRAVYVMDLPGHGRSSKEVGDGSLETLASVVCDFMVSIGIETAHLVGHSLGAAIALQIASGSQARTASLTLIAPAGLAATINDEFLQGFASASSRREMKAAMAHLFADKSLVTRDLVDETLKSTRIDGVREALQAIAAACFEGGKQTASFNDFLAATSVPILIIAGAKDEIVAVPEGLEIRIIKDAGHMPHMEAAGEVNELIRRHLENIG
jgi:pyruvate dehydrogenase E2 component (dihydrolipoamide acetyltransferase)